MRWLVWSCKFTFRVNKRSLSRCTSRSMYGTKEVRKLLLASQNPKPKMTRELSRFGFEGTAPFSAANQTQLTHRFRQFIRVQVELGVVDGFRGWGRNIFVVFVRVPRFAHAFLALCFHAHIRGGRRVPVESVRRGWALRSIPVQRALHLGDGSPLKTGRVVVWKHWKQTLEVRHISLVGLSGSFLLLLTFPV